VKIQDWIFSFRYGAEGARDLWRVAVVGPARPSTVETALHLAGVPEDVRALVRADETVRRFVDGLLDPDASGYYAPCPMGAGGRWLVCIGSVQEVLR
jgi:hypothetical protein